MGHEDEPTFFDEVEIALRAVYGDANVTREEFLAESWRWCDLVVETDQGSFIEPDVYAVEVEETAAEAIDSVDQAAMYAGELAADPVVVVPEGHTEQPEMSNLEAMTEVRIVELPDVIDA